MSEVISRDKCSCGVVCTDTSPFVGFQSLFDGTVAELRNCAVCRSTMCVRVINDASVCTGCRALVTGAHGDPKIVVHHADGGVYCKGCAPTLLGVDDDGMIDTWRAARRILAAGGHLRRPMLTDKEIES